MPRIPEHKWSGPGTHDRRKSLMFKPNLTYNVIAIRFYLPSLQFRFIIFESNTSAGNKLFCIDFIIKKIFACLCSAISQAFATPKRDTASNNVEIWHAHLSVTRESVCMGGGFGLL
eukprot:1028370_1